MSCIIKLRSSGPYTKTEEKIIHYIIEHKSDIIYDSAQTLAANIACSPAALIRLSKKVGYSGFTELKLALASDQDDVADEDSMTQHILESDSLESIIKKEQISCRNTVEETFAHIQYPLLEKAVRAISNAKFIHLFGIGASAICCLDLTQKFSRIGLYVIYHNDYHTQMAASAHIGSGDVAIGISSRGRTPEVNAIMRHAKNKGATTISITQIQHNPLHKLSDILLTIPHQENELRLGAISSRDATLIYTDLLYLGVMQGNFSHYREILRYTRATVKNIYDE